MLCVESGAVTPRLPRPRAGESSNVLTEDDFLRLIELRSPIDPPAWDVEIDDEGLRLVVRPGLPWMAYLTSIVLAPGGFVGAGIGMGIPWLFWVGVVFALAGTTTVVAIRRHQVRLGAYAEWDRETGRLRLDRFGGDFAQEDIAGLQLLHAFQSDAQGNAGAQISEIHLVVHAGEHAVARYPLVAWNPRRPVKAAASKIADELGRPLREWRFGKSRRRSGIGWPKGRGPYPAQAWNGPSSRLTESS